MLYPQGLSANLIGMMVAMIVAVGVLIQTVSPPDSDLGLIAPLGLVLGLAARGELSILVALATGSLILVMHVGGWSLAAMLPRPWGVWTREAWLLAGSSLLGGSSRPRSRDPSS